MNDFTHITERLEADIADILGPELQRSGACGVLIGTIDNTADRLYGVWNDSLCYTLRAQFSGDRWCGPAPTIGLNFEQIARDAGDTEGAMAAVAAHEFAHAMDVFCGGGDLFAVAPPRSIEASRDQLNAFMANPTPPTPRITVIEHGEQFRRLTLHLAHRLQLRGWTTPLPWLFGSEVAGQWAYVSALADELNDMQGAPLWDVVQMPPPDAFTEAWEADKEFILREEND